MQSVEVVAQPTSAAENPAATTSCQALATSHHLATNHSHSRPFVRQHQHLHSSHHERKGKRLGQAERLLPTEPEAAFR